MYPYYFPLYVVGNRCFTREIFDVPSHRHTETPSQSIPEQGHVDHMLYTGLGRSNKHESPPESWLLPRSIAAAAKTLFRVELGHKPPSRRIWPIPRHKQEVRFRWWSWASDTRLAGVRMEKEAIWEAHNFLIAIPTRLSWNRGEWPRIRSRRPRAAIRPTKAAPCVITSGR